jgi:hypothetical protein
MRSAIVIILTTSIVKIHKNEQQTFKRTVDHSFEKSTSWQNEQHKFHQMKNSPVA